jgi:glycerol-3-phosphate dehydrogenase
VSAPAFSPEGRRAALRAMGSGVVDLLVVGGGITGCGIARDAALRGLSVALVEREDFGAGTSGRSSKLIHGGLRYLAHGELAMVRECARERQVLRRIAPHLVHPLKFLMPLWPEMSAAQMRLALWLFDQLAGADQHERRGHIGADEVVATLQGIRQPVKGGLTYGEYITDDARLTLENAMSAARHGALVANHAPVTGLLLDRGRAAGALVQDQLTGEAYEVRARVVVNATGPWAGEWLQQMGVAPQKPLLPSKGVHLLLRAERLPIPGAVILTARSGRSGFAIRRGDWAYVGTTDEAHQGALDGITADGAAVAGLLRLLQDCFPGLDLQERDIAGTWAGLRPLIAAPGRSARDTSRHDEVWESPEGVITVAGGKLTAYRPMASRVMQHVSKLLGHKPAPNPLTAEVPLPGAEGAPPALDLPAGTARRLAWLYGSRTAAFAAMALEDPAWLEPLAPGVPAVKGEVRLALEQEMAASLIDFLDRRAALLLFSHDHGLAAAEPAAAIMGARLGWNPAQQERQIEAYRSHAARHGSLNLT